MEYEKHFKIMKSTNNIRKNKCFLIILKIISFFSNVSIINNDISADHAFNKVNSNIMNLNNIENEMSQ